MHMTLHLTARCNMRCHYCYAPPHDEPDMTPEIARGAVRLAMEANEKRSPGKSLGIIFFGGEPLLMRGLIEDTLRHCRDVEASTGQLFHHKITTNGLLLDEGFLTDPLTRDVFVALSHDGVRQAHDAHRVDAGGNGTFERLEEKAELLLRHKPYAPVMLVTRPDTVRHYAASVEHLFGLGFRYLICSLDYSARWHERDIAELRRQYRRLARWYEQLTRAEEKFYFSPFEVKIGTRVFPGRCEADRCELGQRQLSVGPEGGLYPCVQFVGDPAFRIGDVWAGIDEEARLRLYERNAAEKETCAGCAIRERCNHFCGCLNRQATGSIEQVSPALCAHERTVLPIADRLAERLFRGRSALFIQKHYNELYPLISLVEDTARQRAGPVP